MLSIYFGNLADAIYDTSLYFNNVYDDSWLESEFARAVIRDVDKSEVISTNCIQSPVLGQIAPTMLSGGTKTLLLMMFDDSNIYNASMCGDNCAKWILEISKSKDLVINLMHTMNFNVTQFDAKIMNDGTIVHSNDEYLDEAFKYV